MIEGCLDDIIVYVIDKLNAYLEEVNGIFGLYEKDYNYSIDEPRISNYPDNIITSKEQMFEAMRDGLVNWENKHAHFYWDKSRENHIRENIINFFNEYPDGIIDFG
jgi:hypothetical protein